MVSIAVSHYIPVMYCDTLMGLNFNPDYYVDITKYFKLKVKAILKHESQNPQRFVELAKMMNSYRWLNVTLQLVTSQNVINFVLLSHLEILENFCLNLQSLDLFILKALKVFYNWIN